jgi:eukaryotic-like serine/threonine-protein kinase
MSEKAPPARETAQTPPGAPTAASTGMRHATDPLIGQTLDGRYRIERLLGEGGMGMVYKSVHTTLGKPLAIKVLRPEVSKNEEILLRFRQEAQSASQIGNPHIIDISDFGTLPDGSTYFVMEFLTGKSLTVALFESKFSTARTIHVIKQLAGALCAAHEIGIVHRDLKPDNVQLIERGGQRDFVKVLDFGIAKVGGSTSKLTQAGQVFGTPHYMSPEQCAGANVDQRTDIYAVGVMLYEMVCGKVPFDADNLMGILTKHLYENPVAPHDLAPPANCPPALEAVIMKCLQKKPEQRYQSMVELSADLEAVERGQVPRATTEGFAHAGPQTLTGVEARVTAFEPATEMQIRKNRGPMVFGLAALVLAIGAGAWFAFGRTAQPVASGTGSEAPGVHSDTVLPEGKAPPEEPSAPPAAANQPPAQPPAKPQEAAPAAVASLNVTSKPERAEVYVDGQQVGITPYVLSKPGPNKTVTLKLRLDGYEDRQVEITEQSRDTFLQLEKEPSKPKNTAASDQPKRPTASAPKPAKPAPAKPVPTKPAPTKPAGTKPTPAPSPDVLDPWN